MNKTSRLEGDGYAVEVSLLKLKAPVLVLAATCFVVLVALLSWLGGGAHHLAAAKTDASHTASRERRVEPPLAMPNSATSQPARDENKRADASKASPAADAAPGPSPAGFAENAAQNAAAPAAPEVKENNAAAANAATQADARNVAADAATNGAGGGYTVQTGSFPNVSEANERVSALRAAGFEARAVAVELPKRGTWYRVYAGRFASREEAVALDRKLRASGTVSQTIVTAVQD